MDKQALHRSLLGALAAELETLEAAQRLSSEGVTHADAKADGIKDMRATEASYIARGQALRVASLRADLERVEALRVRPFGPDDPIALSAVVTVCDDDDQSRRMFLAPAGGGTRLGDIRVVTPGSPMGRALLGRRVGDEVEVKAGPAGGQQLEITDVA